MQVKQGWSGEVSPNQWAKVDVTLDEDDLRRILLTAGLEEVDPANLPVYLVFQILDAEAERLVVAKLVTTHGYEGQAQLAAAQANRQKALAKVRDLWDGKA